MLGVMHSPRLTVRQFYQANLLIILAVVTAAAFDMRTAAILSLLPAIVWLTMLLIIPRFMDFDWLADWRKDMVAIAKLSKHTGLVAAGYFVGHAALLASEPLPPRLRLLQYMVIIIFAFLAGLSNSWSYDHIKLWKHFNMLAWALPALLVAYLLLVGRYVGEPWFVGLAGAMCMIAATLSGLLPVFAGKKGYFDRLRLYMLFGGGILALLVISLV